MRIFLIFLLNITILYSQIKVAVLDFENTSTIEKYDGFGKAMSNMLLTDLKNNIHPRKVSFLERSQLNKILNEQQLQNTKNFDKNTAVTFGKLAGVKYVILGGIYVLDGVCNLNSRMVDVESSEIIYAKESNGKITDWLNLKTKLAEEVSLELNNPIEIEEDYTNVEVNEGTISQYSKVIELLENRELDKANEFLALLRSIQPEFKYYDDLQSELETIKQQLEKIEKDVEVTTTDPISAAENYDNLGNYKEAEKYYLIGLNRLKKNQIGNYLLYNLLLARLSFKYQDYEKSVFYSNKILEVYSLFNHAVYIKTQSLLKLKKQKEFIEWSIKYLNKADEIGNIKFYNSSLEDFKSKNKIEERINDININNISTQGFSINVNNFEIMKPDQMFGFVLETFTEINSKLYGLDSTLNFLDKLNSSNGFTNSYKSKINHPYYLPKFKYTTKESNSEDKLIIVVSGKLYKGPYFSAGGVLWTNSGPNECRPCLRLLPEKKHKMLNQNFIRKNWQITSYMAEGWNSLLNKDNIKSRKRFGQIIYYLIHDEMNNYDKLYEFINKSIIDLDLNKPKKSDKPSLERAFHQVGKGYSALRDILNIESGNYTGKENLNFLEALCNNSIVNSSNDLCNNIINFAHTYLIEGDIVEALKIYKYLNPELMVKGFNLTVEQVIDTDLSDFENRGIIERGVKEKVKNNLQANQPLRISTH